MRISVLSSDLCSSDLVLAITLPDSVQALPGVPRPPTTSAGRVLRTTPVTVRASVKEVISDRKSVVTGKRVSVRVDIGGRRIINKKKHLQIDRTVIPYMNSHITSTYYKTNLIIQ